MSGSLDLLIPKLGQGSLKVVVPLMRELRILLNACSVNVVWKTLSEDQKCKIHN